MTDETWPLLNELVKKLKNRNKSLRICGVRPELKQELCEREIFRADEIRNNLKDILIEFTNDQIV